MTTYLHTFDAAVLLTCDGQERSLSIIAIIASLLQMLLNAVLFVRPLCTGVYRQCYHKRPFLISRQRNDVIFFALFRALSRVTHTAPHVKQGFSPITQRAQPGLLQPSCPSLYVACVLLFAL